MSFEQELKFGERNKITDKLKPSAKLGCDVYNFGKHLI